MRVALWILALFVMAVAMALVVGNNQSTVTLFWPPHRVDVSLNLALLVLLLGFVALHLALRALAALLELPHQARRWRAQQRERAAQAALLEALGNLVAGRFVRARKAAELALAREAALAATGQTMGHAAHLRALAHLVAAESAQALQDQTRRDQHLQQALEHAHGRGAPALEEMREGVQIRAASWSLQDHDASAALAWLDGLPQGAGRRTLALRLRLKAQRLARQSQAALETTRLLAKHRAFSDAAGRSIVRGLATELITTAPDSEHLLRVWSTLDEAERSQPELAFLATQRLCAVKGDPQVARSWLLPVWQQLLAQPGLLAQSNQGVKLARAVEATLVDTDQGLDRDWLDRIETAQQQQPGQASLQYLAGVACLKHQLWGKAQQLLTQATRSLQDPGLRASAWRALAILAEQRGDAAAAAQAWRQAAS